MGASLGRLLSFSRVGVCLSLIYAFSNLSMRHKKLFLVALGVLYYAWRLRFFSRRWPAPPPGASIFITGADTGIGRSTALYLNSLGYQVFAGVLNKEIGENLKEKVTYARNFFPVVCDVTNNAQVEEAMRTVSATTGGQLWGLVNNAGVSLADGPVEYVPMSRVHKTLDVNLFGVWNVTRTFLPLIRNTKGRVVNIASINGFIVWEFHAAYCVSKHGVEALSDCLRLELNPLDCFVAIIEPGGIATDIWEQARKVLGECWNEMGSECWKAYGKRDMEATLKALDESTQRNSDPMVVANAIHHALTSPFPYARYKVGFGAGLLGVLCRCPESWKDAVTRKFFGGRNTKV